MNRESIEQRCQQEEITTHICDNVSNKGEHGNTSVLELNVTELVELLLIAILGIAQDAERIEAAKGGLGSHFSCEISLEGGAGLAGLGRSKGGGADQESREDGTLHCCIICLVIGLGLRG